MNIFWRYFVHFILMSGLLSLIILLISLVSYEMTFSPLIVIAFILGDIYFSLGMALFCKERSEMITLIANNDKKTLNEIEKIIVEKTGKKEVVKEGEYIVHYCSKSKYLKWLTNDITIIKEEKCVKLEFPREYTKLFNKYIYE